MKDGNIDHIHFVKASQGILNTETLTNTGVRTLSGVFSRQLRCWLRATNPFPFSAIRRLSTILTNQKTKKC